MATTTNYGWTTPDDTALVKDGAAAIRSLGTAIDTTTYNNAQAAIAKTLIDAKGDLIVGSAADTAARLAVGTNDYVLTADSTATNGVKWAAAASGSLTLLSTTSLSGNQVDLTSISGSYKALKLILTDITFNSDEGVLALRLNNNSTAAAYVFSGFGTYDGGGTPSLFSSSGEAKFNLVRAAMKANQTDNLTIVDIPDYANATTFKLINSHSVFKEYGATTNGEKYISYITGGFYASPAAITELNIYLTNSKTFSTGTAYLYGVN